MIVESNTKEQKEPTMISDFQAITGEYLRFEGEKYFRIGNSHLMDDFFMSLVGASDHWMFVSSNGALTTGRRNPDTALFPYAADDQISAARAKSGSLTLIRIEGDNPVVWQPFSADVAQPFEIRRNLYKTPLGDKLIFEEINETLGLLFRYRWAFSEKFGFVRSCHIENTGDAELSFKLLDGIQDIVPFGAESEFPRRTKRRTSSHNVLANRTRIYRETDLDSATGRVSR